MLDWIKDGKLAGTTQEKSWKLFHTNITKLNVPGLELFQARILFFRIFKLLLKKKWPPKTVSYENISANKKCDQRDFEILAYIGGALVRKLKDKYLKAKQEDKQAIVEMLATTHDSPTVLYSNLIRTRNRGGLTYLKQSTVEFMGEIEGLFRDIFKDGTSFSRQRFIDEAFSIAGNDF